jgi:transposase-like protein
MEDMTKCLFVCHLDRVFLFLGHRWTLMKEIIDLCELIDRFGNDQKCRNYLEHLRWPHGVECPNCGSDKVSSILKRDQYDCDSCRHQFSVTAGTIFHDTHLPLTKWFLATYLLCQSKKGMSAHQLHRMLKIHYRTAWYLFHRIRHAVEQATEPKLDGICEVDETYVGGKKIGQGVYAGKRAKEVVIGIRERKGPLRFFHAEDAKSGTLAKYIRENISGTVSVIVTDDFVTYPSALRKAEIPADKHKVVNHSAKQYVVGDFHTNSVESAFSLLKRGIVGTWHKVSAKHLPAYLDEMTWRFNNRKNPFLFRDTMLRLLTSENLEYKELTKAA